MATGNKKSNAIQLLILSLTAFLFVVISEQLYTKFDLTEDKRYTLSEETIDLLDNVNDKLRVKIYLEDDQLPAGFIKLRNSVEEMVNEFNEHCDDNIQFEFINLQEIESQTEKDKEIIRLSQLGIPYVPVQQKKSESQTNSFYVTPGAEMFYGGRSVGVNFLSTDQSNFNDNFQQSIELLEYQISNGIRKLLRPRAQNVGFLQLHGESDQFQLQDIAKTLSEYYNIGPVFLQNEQGLYDLNALNLIDILVIAGPQVPFNELELIIVDQFIMKGGKVLFMVDGVYANIDSLRKAPVFPAISYESGLDKLIYSYGIRLNSDIVEDLQCTQIPIQTGAAGSSGKPSLYPWVYFPIVDGGEDHIISRNIEPVKLEFASSLDLLEKEGVESTELLHSSDNSNFLKTPCQIGFENAIKAYDKKSLSKNGKAVAAIAEGKFASYFKNRILPPEFSERKTLKTESVDNSFIVISSGSFADNIVMQDDRTLPLGSDRYTNSFFDNKKFLLNCINYLSGDADLINVRSKEIKLRLLDKAKLKKEENSWVILNITAPLLFIAIVSILAHIIRRKKFKA